jgi:PilZ domain
VRDFRLPERRRARRFEIDLPVSYRPEFSKTVKSGKVVNISSAGVLFTVQDATPITAPVELIVDWPVKRNGEVPLTLFIRGRVVRRQAGAVAIEIGRAVLGV